MVRKEIVVPRTSTVEPFPASVTEHEVAEQDATLIANDPADPAAPPVAVALTAVTVALAPPPPLPTAVELETPAPPAPPVTVDWARAVVLRVPTIRAAASPTAGPSRRMLRMRCSPIDALAAGHGAPLLDGAFSLWCFVNVTVPDVDPLGGFGDQLPRCCRLSRRLAR